jgi:hypothetical protein
MDIVAFLTKQFKHNIDKLGGVKVPVEQAEARIEVCESCDEISRGFFYDSCGLCKCPLVVKPYFESHLLSALNITVVQDEEDRKKVICPHPSGNKWAIIDNNFN